MRHQPDGPRPLAAHPHSTPLTWARHGCAGSWSFVRWVFDARPGSGLHGWPVLAVHAQEIAAWQRQQSTQAVASNATLPAHRHRRQTKAALPRPPSLQPGRGVACHRFCQCVGLHGQSLGCSPAAPALQRWPQPWCWLVPQWMLSSACGWPGARRAWPMPQRLVVMIGMTLAATAIDPSWWLHPWAR